MDIGKEERTIIVEPLETPVPQRTPEPMPEPEKVPEREPEKVPVPVGPEEVAAWQG